MRNGKFYGAEDRFIIFGVDESKTLHETKIEDSGLNQSKIKDLILSNIDRPTELRNKISMESFLRLSKAYRILLSFIAVFTFAGVGAGSHSGIDLNNIYTLFYLAIVIVFLITVTLLFFFTKSRNKKWNSFLGIMTLLALSLSSIFTITLIGKILSRNLNQLSMFPYVAVLLLSPIVILGSLI